MLVRLNRTCRSGVSPGIPLRTDDLWPIDSLGLHVLTSTVKGAFPLRRLKAWNPKATDTHINICIHALNTHRALHYWLSKSKRLCCFVLTLMVFLSTLLNFHRVTKSGTALLINARSSDLRWESLVSKFRVVKIGIISLRDALSTSNRHIMKAFIRNLGGLVVQGEWECVCMCVCVLAAWYAWEYTAMFVYMHVCVAWFGTLSHQGHCIWATNKFHLPSLFSLTGYFSFCSSLLLFLSPLYHLHSANKYLLTKLSI